MSVPVSAGQAAITQLEAAAELLHAGRLSEARAAVELVLAARPKLAEAHRLLGLCLHRQADLPGAEAAFRAGLRHDRANPDLATALADLLTDASRQADAERVLRAALAENRRSAAIAARLAQSLTASGRAEEALRLTAKLAQAAQPDHLILSEQAAALKALGQPDRALAVYERAASLYPADPVAHHNLAASHGDFGHAALAERSAARALSGGGAAPQTWLVYGRALVGLGRLDEAERAFRQAISRQPLYADAHRDLAQLVWMRSADAAPATALLDSFIRANPHAHPLWALRANVLQHAGDLAGALDTLLAALRLHPDQPGLLLAASQLSALCGRPAEAVRFAEQAALHAPGETADGALFAACVAAGQAERASCVAACMLQRQALDQRALAYQATAWRLLGDARYGALYDYANMVRAWRMDTPDGWQTLDAYLADLTQALGGLHAFHTHPLDQSLRHGSQAAHLLASENPVVRAFFQAVDGPIRRHLAALGQGGDPLRGRNTGGYAYRGAWSVRLRPGGFHVDHVHPEGWLSSACYVALPETERPGRQAWIKFGEPGIPTQPALGAEHYVRPEVGMLVLFPSYMWHGTVPFEGDVPRLSVAFDLMPKARGSAPGPRWGQSAPDPGFA